MNTVQDFETKEEKVNAQTRLTSLREHIIQEIKNKRELAESSRDRETNNILDLVRGLSNQDDIIPNNPEFQTFLKFKNFI